MPSCPNCKNSETEVDEARGTVTCTTCGTVLEDSIIVSEVTYTDEHGVNERYVDAEGRGTYSMGVQGFHGLGRDSRAVTIANGRTLIKQMASSMQLNQHHVDTAINYFKLAVDHRFTQGRPSEHVVASCLFIVCRREQTSHMLLDFADHLKVNVFTLASTFLKLCNKLHVTLPVVDPVLYIPRFAHVLNFGDKAHDVGKTALRIVSRMKRDWIHVGRRPAGVCGAGLLLAARIHGFSRSQKDVISAVRICCTTLKQRLEEFGDTPSGSLTLSDFQSIELEGEADPPAYQRAQAQRQLLERRAIQQLDGEQAALEDVVAQGNDLASSAAFASLDDDEAIDGAAAADGVDGGPAVPAAEASDLSARQMQIAKPSSHIEQWTLPEVTETLSDVEEDDVADLILAPSEVQVKTKLWTKDNEAYLAKVEARRAEEGDRPRKTRKRRRGAAGEGQQPGVGGAVLPAKEDHISAKVDQRRFQDLMSKLKAKRAKRGSDESGSEEEELDEDASDAESVASSDAAPEDDDGTVSASVAPRTAESSAAAALPAAAAAAVPATTSAAAAAAGRAASVPSGATAAALPSATPVPDSGVEPTQEESEEEEEEEEEDVEYEEEEVLADEEDEHEDSSARPSAAAGDARVRLSTRTDDDADVDDVSALIRKDRGDGEDEDEDNFGDDMDDY